MTVGVMQVRNVSELEFRSVALEVTSSAVVQDLSTLTLTEGTQVAVAKNASFEFRTGLTLAGAGE